MSIAVTRTKIRVPRRRADLLSRPRLNSTLVDLLDYPFTLISAPAGYGKTCLMIDLACLASYPACWYSIDPLDQDPKRFLAHFIHAIKMEFPDFGKPSLGLLDNLPDPLSSPDQLVSTLINDIYNSISENFVIFLDDYHFLDDQPRISRFISRFGQQMDENTHLVMASRKLFNFPDLPLLIGRKFVKGVDQVDLAFHPQELREYFQEKLQQSLSEKDSVEMIANTAGWITGLLLKKENKNSLVPEQNKAARVTGADLDAYFADQVFEKQPVEVRTQMLRTSLFDEFNTSFCHKVLGEPDKISWSEFLDALTDHNLFVEQVEDNGVWVRYHHLFRDFLNRELENHHPGEKQHILSRLVKTHIESQGWEQAFDAARQLEDPQKMAEVIDLAFSPLFHAGRIKLLSDWLEILPEEGYLAFPILYSLKGFSSTELGNPFLGLSEINKAISNEQINSDPKFLSKSLVWRSTANRILGSYNKGISDSLEAIKTISNETYLLDIEAEAYRELGLGYGRMGNSSEALEFLNKSLNKYKICKKTNSLAQVQVDIGHILLNMGKFQKAESAFVDTIPHWSQQGNNIHLAMIMNNLASLSTQTGNFLAADDWLNQGEKHAILSSSKRMEAYIAASRGDLVQSLKLFGRSLGYYDKAHNLSKEIPDSFLLVYLPIAKATCLRCQNKFTPAIETLKKLQEIVCQGASKFELGLWHLEWGYTHLAQNSLDTAQEAFQTARDIFARVSKPHEQAKSLLGLCLVADAQGENKSLKKYLDELQIILAEAETIQPLLPEFSQQQEGIKRILSHLPGLDRLQSSLDEIRRYLRGLPEAQKRIYSRGSAVSETPGLEIQAFGEISVSRAGKRITASEWIHQKTVREIFFYLLSHPRGVTKEQVGLAFWPDSSPNQLSCQFKNAIYRLRRAIGVESILYLQETRSYTFNWAGRYTFDVEEFQKAHKLAISQPGEDDRSEHLRRAVSIYKHPFAPQLGGTWAEPVRRKFYLAYEKAQLELAVYDLKTDNYPGCRDACLAILEIEPCQEKAYQLCMEAYSGLNDVTELRRLFISCEENFNNILGIRPSNITINLFKELSSK